MYATQTSTTSDAITVSLPFYVPPLICQKGNKKYFVLLNCNIALFKVHTSLLTFHTVLKDISASQTSIV